MIEGVVVHQLVTHMDERGFFREVIRVTDDHFEEGFDWKTIVGAIFIGFLMMPGSMYLQLVIGTGIGPAARWVTIILFAELAKRSYSELKQ